MSYFASPAQSLDISNDTFLTVHYEDRDVKINYPNNHKCLPIAKERILMYNKSKNSFLIFKIIRDKLVQEKEIPVHLPLEYEFQYFLDIDPSETRILFIATQFIDRPDSLVDREERLCMYDIMLDAIAYYNKSIENYQGKFLNEDYFLILEDSLYIYVFEIKGADIAEEPSYLKLELDKIHHLEEGLAGSVPQLISDHVLLEYDQGKLRLFNLLIEEGNILPNSKNYTNFYADRANNRVIAMKNRTIKEWDSDGKEIKEYRIKLQDRDLYFYQILKKYYDISYIELYWKGLSSADSSIIDFPYNSKEINDNITVIMNKLLKSKLSKNLRAIVERFLYLE